MDFVLSDWNIAVLFDFGSFGYWEMMRRVKQISSPLVSSFGNGRKSG